MSQNRFKSVVVWASIVSLILSILVQCGVLLPDQAEGLKGAITGILDALVIFGILNNPRDPVEF
jgi:uncharacterized membrane protein